MIVYELFERLSYGELSNLALSNDGSGKIEEDKQAKLINYINEALIRLYTRFIIKEKTLLIEQYDHITNYHLRKKYAHSSDSNVRYKYIVDLGGEPFNEDVIRILEVWNSFGFKYTLNDENSPNSLFTPQPLTLQVPSPVTGRPMNVIYQARHPILRSDENLLNQEVDIPYFLESALLNYVAYKVYSHMNGQENLVSSQGFKNAYEEICLDVEQKDLINQTFNTTSHKLNSRGFA